MLSIFLYAYMLSVYHLWWDVFCPFSNWTVALLLRFRVLDISPLWLCGFSNIFPPTSSLSFHVVAGCFVEQTFSSSIYQTFVSGIMFLVLCLKKSLHKDLGSGDFFLYYLLNFYSFSFKFIINFQLILCKVWGIVWSSSFLSLPVNIYFPLLKRQSSSIELLLHPCQSLVGCICVAFSLSFLFYSVDLFVFPLSEHHSIQFLWDAVQTELILGTKDLVWLKPTRY